jgi:integrase/recombinase XerC
MSVTPEPISLKLVEDFLTYCGARNLSVHTLRAYRSDLTQFVASSGEVVALNRKLVRRFLVELHNAGLKPLSVKRKLAAVKSFCRWLEAEGFAEAGLIDFIASRYRRDELPDVPSEGEVARLLDGDLSPRDRLILELLYGCGIRNSELVGINLDDFQDPDILIVRGKGKKERFVIVGEYAQAALKVWLQAREKILRKIHLKTPALFFSVGPHRSAERLDVRSVGRVIKTAAETCGLDPKKWHPHLLRHAAATHMCDHGAALQSVSTLLGHSKLSTTQIYTRVSTGRLRRSYDAAHPHAKVLEIDGTARARYGAAYQRHRTKVHARHRPKGPARK